MRQLFIALRNGTLVFAAILLGATSASVADENRTRQVNEQLDGLVREPLSLKVTLQDGRQATLDAFVTRPNKSGRFPIALITHGTNGDASDRKLNPNRFSSPAIAFARHGYAAVVVLRQGYGKSTGDNEYVGGTCKSPRHARAGRVARDNLTAALKAIRDQPWASRDQSLLVGMSSGGFGVLATGALNPPGVQAVINFDGGRGAPEKGRFCDQNGLINAVKSYGQTAHIPTLWIYSTNDKSFSPTLGRKMFDSYRQAGGVAEFFQTAAFEDDGHTILISAPESFWWQRVALFLKNNKLSNEELVTLSSANLSPPDNMSLSGYDAFKEYLAMQSYEKAFATNVEGAWGWTTWARTQEEAAKRAITLCQKGRKKNETECTLYAAGNQMAAHEKSH